MALVVVVGGGRLSVRPCRLTRRKYSGGSGCWVAESTGGRCRGGQFL